jgi:NAD(P)-dependent dehydrogenase (short-subunit alcohol dehydrogenase family)
MSQPGSVLVTGASTGIGRLTVERLARNGWRVFASVRKGTDADSLAALHEAITPLLFDVTDAEGIATAAKRIDLAVGDRGLDGLVNNAGIAVGGPLEFLPLEQLRYQLEVNVTAQVAVTQALMPTLRRARGRIVFVGSVAGRSPLPFIGAYAASKSALHALAASLRVEVRPWGIAVSVIEPAAYASSIWDTALDRADRVLLPDAAGLETYYGATLQAVRRMVRRAGRAKPPHAVALVIEKALLAKHPRARYPVGLGARSRAVFELLPTRLRDALIAASMRRA